MRDVIDLVLRSIDTRCKGTTSFISTYSLQADAVAISLFNETGKEMGAIAFSSRGKFMFASHDKFEAEFLIPYDEWTNELSNYLADELEKRFVNINKQAGPAH